MWTRPDFDLLNDPPTQDFSRQHELEALAAGDLAGVDTLHNNIVNDHVLAGNAVNGAQAQVGALGSSIFQSFDLLKLIHCGRKQKDVLPFLEQAQAQDREISGAAGDIGDTLGSIS